MPHHLFLFSPAIWLGQGIICFSYSPDHLEFYTRWKIEPITDQGQIRCHQTVQIVGVQETTENEILITPIDDTSFDIQLSNELLEQPIAGKGSVEEGTISWEFTNNPDYEGFESYTLDPKGAYQFDAEYATTNFRTLIRGHLWQKSGN